MHEQNNLLKLQNSIIKLFHLLIIILSILPGTTGKINPENSDFSVRNFLTKETPLLVRKRRFLL
jgi:hypothetical protein